MGGDEDGDFKIVDPEYYGGEGKHEFSHQSLMMSSLMRCMEAGSTEMRAGYTNKKTDKNGNMLIMYVEDTRLKFIESVKTLKSIMACYFDDDATKNIGAAMEKITVLKKNLLREQAIFWNSLNGMARAQATKDGMQVVEGFLNVNLPYYKLYIDEQVLIYREIFEEINKLAQRKNFFTEAMFIG